MKRLILLFGWACAAQAAELKLPPALEPVMRLALSAPPEFAADGLLQLVESRKIEDRETAVALTQQAFDLAAAAHFQVARKAAMPLSGDSRQGVLAKAYALGLDTVSLQARAVTGMAALDKKRARLMLRSMVKPELPPLTCDDLLVYDPGPLYRALATVEQTAFTAAERAKEDHVSLLLEYVSQVHSPVQIAPLIAAVRASGLQPAQAEAVWVNLSGRLEALGGDPRSFAATLDAMQAALPAELAVSFQKYLEKNQAAGACPAGKAEPFWLSDPAQRILAGASRLRFSPDRSRVLSDAERGAPEWRQQLADFEKLLDGWEAASEKSEADYFHQKSIVYEALVELIPPGPEREKTVQAFLAFLGGSNLQSQSPVEWFVPAEALLQRLRSTNGGEPDKLLTALEGSGSPVWSLYVALQRTLDHSTPWFVKSS